MQKRIYDAEVIEMMVSQLKDDYTRLMHKAMDENDSERVERASAAIVALGILEDRIFNLPNQYKNME